MAHLRPRYRYRDGKKLFTGYAAEFYDPSRHPKRKYVTLRTTDKSTAEQKKAQYERDMAMGHYDPWNDAAPESGLTVSVAVKRFVKSRKEHCADSTVSVYEYVLEAFAASVPTGVPLEAIESKHIRAFLKKRENPLAESTEADYKDRLRIFFEWCRSNGLTKSVPITKQRGRGKKSRLESLPEFLSEKEFGHLVRTIRSDATLKNLDTGNQWIIDAMEFAVGTGVRLAELASLKWSGVDLHEKMVTVRNTEDFSTKSGRERSVPLVGGALDVIRRLHHARASEADENVFKGATGGPVGAGYLSERFRKYRRDAKLPENIRFHSLRHTFASWFVLRGGDLYRLKEILGHADMKTTLKYAHLRPDALRAEMEQTFGKATETPAEKAERLRREIDEREAELKTLEKEFGTSAMNGENGVHP